MNTDTIENIRIEDPLDFLDASEKEEYIKERHREEDARLKRLGEEERASSEAARAMSERERQRLKRDTDDPLRDRPRRAVPKEDAEPIRGVGRGRPSDGYEDEDYENYEDEDADDYDDDYDEEEDEDDSRRVIMASGILGILIVLVLLFMLWLRFFMPVPEEPEAEERARVEAEEAVKEAEEEELTRAEEAEAELLLAEGFVRVDDTVVTTAGLNMRSEPDSDRDNVITTVAEGTALKRVAVNETTNWSAVIVPDYDDILYCSGKYLRAE